MTSQIPTVRLGDPHIAEFILGQSPPSSSYNERGEGLPFFQGKVDFGLIWPTPRVWCNDGQQFARRLDVLVSVRAPVGDVNLADTDCVIGRGVTAIRAGADSDPWFLFFAMQHVKPVLAQRATGSTFGSVNKATLQDIQIPQFPLAEQRGIARQLRHVLMSMLGEHAIVRTADKLKRAAMCEMFTRGLRGEPQKETEIGGVPESWDVCRLGEICTLSTGTTPSTKREDYYRGTTPFIKTAEITNNRLRAATTFVSDEAVADYNLTVYSPGTILLAMYGQGKTRGQAALLEIAAATTQNAAAIEPSARVHAAFLWHYLMSIYERLRGMGSLGHLSHLNLGYLRELSVPVPSPEEQREITAILDAVDRKVDLHQKKRAVLDELLRSLLHKLMTGEVRVADIDISALPTSCEARP